MGSFNVEITWKGKVFNLDIESTSDVSKFKNALFQQTGVPEDKQKLMAKSKGLWKGILKDDEDLSKFDWSDGAKITLIGNSEGVPKKQKADVVFVEDMTAKEQQKLGKNLPPGLENLGNTCYMNSTLQCLRAAPELKRALETLAADPNSTVGSNGKMMTAALGKLFTQMDDSRESVTPMNYVRLMRAAFPRFAEEGPKGGFAQQDADEYFSMLFDELARQLTTPVEDVEFGNMTNAVDALFGIDTTVEWRCAETDAEEPTFRSERLRRLQCTITDEVGTLEQGLKAGFEGEFEKNSEVLGRNAKWKSFQKLHRVPLYLVVHFKRFFWKKTPNSRDHQGINCKIRKRVKFPLELDIFQFCDDELKEILKPARDRHTEKLVQLAEDRKDENAMEEDKEIELAKFLSLTEGRTAGPGISPAFRGIYELYGIVTHKGRASNSGHYIGWVKQGPDSWICFDDEFASECKDEDILKLGGDTADWHIAYMAYYRAKMD